MPIAAPYTWRRAARCQVQCTAIFECVFAWLLIGCDNCGGLTPLLPFLVWGVIWLIQVRLLMPASSITLRSFADWLMTLRTQALIFFAGGILVGLVAFKVRGTGQSGLVSMMTLIFFLLCVGSDDLPDDDVDHGQANAAQQKAEGKDFLPTK